VILANQVNAKMTDFTMDVPVDQFREIHSRVSSRRHPLTARRTTAPRAAP